MRAPQAPASVFPDRSGVSSSIVPNEQVPAHASRRQWLPVVISALSGTPGLVIKIVLLSISNALAVWAMYTLATRHNWLAAGVLLAVTVLIDAIYLVRRPGAIPLKFLVPGTVLLVAFQVIPIIYTIDVAFTNYSTGHIETKAEAIPQVRENSKQPDPNSPSYTLAIGKGSGGYAFILQDPSTGKLYIGTQKGLTPAPAGSVTVKDGQIAAAKDYTLVTDIVAISNLIAGPLKNFSVPLGQGKQIATQDGSSGYVVTPTLRYDPKRDAMVSISTGAIYKDNGKGEFANTTETRDVLLPGWRTYIGGKNFSSLFRDPQVRNPFLNVSGGRSCSRPERCFSRSRSGCSSRSCSTSPACGSGGLPVAARHPVGDSGLLDAARLGRSAERRFRGDQPDLPRQRAVALRSEQGEGVVIMVTTWLTVPYFLSSRWARSSRSRASSRRRPASTGRGGSRCSAGSRCRC